MSKQILWKDLLKLYTSCCLHIDHKSVDIVSEHKPDPLHSLGWICIPGNMTGALHEHTIDKSTLADRHCQIDTHCVDRN